MTDLKIHFIFQKGIRRGDVSIFNIRDKIVDQRANRSSHSHSEALKNLMAVFTERLELW